MPEDQDAPPTTATRPEDFPRAFVAAIAARAADWIASLVTEEAQGLTLSGQWAEGRTEMAAAWGSELGGLLSQARLVTGRLVLRPLGPGAAVLTQRYVVIGALVEEGVEMGRFPAVLSAVVIATPGGWQAASLSFSAISA